MQLNGSLNPATAEGDKCRRKRFAGLAAASSIPARGHFVASFATAPGFIQ